MKSNKKLPIDLNDTRQLLVGTSQSFFPTRETDKTITQDMQKNPEHPKEELIVHKRSLIMREHALSAKGYNPAKCPVDD